VLLEVRDDGPGVPPAARDRVFDPYFTTRTEGTGLGLSIVRGILDKHGSRIHMVSEPGVGTTFWFDLALEHADLDDLLVEGVRRQHALAAAND